MARPDDDRDEAADPTPDFDVPVEPPPLLITLERVAADIAVADIDEIWIFSPLRAAGVETAVLVLALFQRDDAGTPRPRRTILTVHYTASRDRRGRMSVQHVSAEHGAAEPDRMGRVIEGVLRRMDESLPPHPPRHERLRGDPVAWAALLESVRADPPAVARGGDFRY